MLPQHLKFLSHSLVIPGANADATIFVLTAPGDRPIYVHGLSVGFKGQPADAGTGEIFYGFPTADLGGTTTSLTAAIKSMPGGAAVLSTAKGHNGSSSTEPAGFNAIERLTPNLNGGIFAREYPFNEPLIIPAGTFFGIGANSPIASVKVFANVRFSEQP
jgi:hypothetical protein